MKHVLLRVFTDDSQLLLDDLNGLRVADNLLLLGEGDLAVEATEVVYAIEVVEVSHLQLCHCQIGNECRELKGTHGIMTPIVVKRHGRVACALCNWGGKGGGREGEDRGDDRLGVHVDRLLKLSASSVVGCAKWVKEAGYQEDEGNGDQAVGLCKELRECRGRWGGQEVRRYIYSFYLRKSLWAGSRREHMSLSL